MRDFDPTASEFIRSGYIANSKPGGLLYDPATIFATLAPTVIGGLLGGGGGDQAIQQGTNAQVNANQLGIAEQRRALEQQRTDLAPWSAGGVVANTERMRRLGLGGNGRIGGFTPKTKAQLRAEMIGQFTTTTAGTPGTPGTGGGFQVVTKEMDPENQWGGVRWVDPVAGTGGGTLIDEAGLSSAVENAFNAQGAAREGEIDPEYGSLMRKFGQRDLDTDLVYNNGLKFGLDTGINQLNQRAINQGGYGSGAALKALTKFGNDYATTKTEGAYNRNMGEKNQIFGMLSGVSQQGQSAAAGQGAAGMSGANSIAGMYGNIGNSQAAGGIAQANLGSQQAAGITDAFRWNQLLNKNNRPATYNPSTHGMGFDRYLSGNLGSGD